MTTLTYNELTNTAEFEGDPLDPMFYYDARFPTERLSKLHMRTEEPMPATPPGRRSKARSRRDRNAARFKTQPITFDEIKEVDEESEENKDALKTQFTAFSKSMEALVRTPSYRSRNCPRTSTPTSDTDSTSHDVSPSHTSSASSLDNTAASTSRDRFHKRRKKRFHRSIEEVPDLERDSKLDPSVL